jgi:energy-converting hydrogenase Eha subunit A
VSTGCNPEEIISNVVSSPLSYLLAFVGAFIWAAYCTVTAKYAKGKNGITLFVLLTALTLWLKFLPAQPPMVFSWPVSIKLMTVSVALGLATRRGTSDPARQRQPAGGGLTSRRCSLPRWRHAHSAALSWSFWQGAGMVSPAPALLVRHPPLTEIAAGHRQRHAGDIAGLIAGEKQDRVRLFRQRAVPVHQTAGHRLIDHLLIPRLFLLARLLIVARRQARGASVPPGATALIQYCRCTPWQSTGSAHSRRLSPPNKAPDSRRRRHRRNIDDAAFALLQHPRQRRAAAHRVGNSERRISFSICSG